MINEILGLISDYGFPAVIAVVIVLILWKLIPFVVKSRVSGGGGGTGFRLFPAKKNTKWADLKYHPFFNNAEYRMTVEIPVLDLIPTKPVKQQMFRDLIFIETKIIYEVCSEIIKLDMSDWTDEQWVTEITKKINEILAAFLKKARDEGIPELVIMKYTRWHSTTFEMLFDHVTTLGTTVVYPDNITRTNTLLIIMGLMLVVTISDAERSLKELNGDLAGKLYKGMAIES